MDMQKTILVVGGAGYIGSHAVRLLGERGYNVVILDNLSSGAAAAVKGHSLIRGDLGDEALLDTIFREHEVHCVMHFAALIFVGESEKDPVPYYDNNVVKTFRLLSAMLRHNVKRFVFSSSAAVYGIPAVSPIREDSLLRPINPYGNTKYIVELMLADLAKSRGLRYTALRYFNAAGAHPDGGLGERHEPENHLIPLVLAAALDPARSIKVFGTDYDTPDGTCVRDYIHVCDLVDAHILAIDAMEANPVMALNLGNGSGFSVREVIAIARDVTGRTINVIEQDRRPGDPPALVADAALGRRLLGWQPRYTDLHEIIRTAWQWHQAPVF